MKDCYAAYMLRLWRAGDGNSSVWRASLENAHTGEMRRFSDRQALYDFLASLDKDPSDDETVAGDGVVQPDADPA